MKIPGFSFWALATGAIVFLLLIGVGMETPTAIIISSIWYILGVGSAYAIYKYHPSIKAHLTLLMKTDQLELHLLL